MSNTDWFLLAMIISVILVGAYYQLQLLAHSKPGRLFSLSTGGWIFHPEDIEEGGQPYRKKLLICYGIFTLLVALLWGSACGT
jgi:hypothetical protein